MKKITFLLSGIIIFFSAQQLNSQTFDWESATDNGATVTQTVGGVTATVSAVRQGGFEDINLINGSGFEGTSANVVFADGGSNESLTVSFSSPISILKMRLFEAGTDPGFINWTFTPSGGGNSPITHSINNSNSAEYTFNWINVNSFTITRQDTGVDEFGLDDIILGTPCTDPDVPTVTSFSNFSL